MDAGAAKYFEVIPLTHHKNSGYTELKVLGVYPFVHRIFSWCAKGIVKFVIIYRPPEKVNHSNDSCNQLYKRVRESCNNYLRIKQTDLDNYVYHSHRISVRGILPLVFIRVRSFN